MNSTLTGSSPSRYNANYNARNPSLILGHPHTLILIGSRTSDCSISRFPLARGARPFRDWLGCRGSCFCGMVAVVPRKICVHGDPHQSEPGWTTPKRCVWLVTESNLSAPFPFFLLQSHNTSFFYMLSAGTYTNISDNCLNSFITSCRALYDLWRMSFWTHEIKFCLKFSWFTNLILIMTTKTCTD